jgi:hypothetical protein
MRRLVVDYLEELIFAEAPGGGYCGAPSRGWEEIVREGLSGGS